MSVCVLQLLGLGLYIRQRDIERKEADLAKAVAEGKTAKVEELTEELEKVKTLGLKSSPEIKEAITKKAEEQAKTIKLPSRKTLGGSRPYYIVPTPRGTVITTPSPEYAQQKAQEEYSAFAGSLAAKMGMTISHQEGGLFLVNEPEAPTTREEFLSSIQERVKEKGGLKGQIIVTTPTGQERRVTKQGKTTVYIEPGYAILTESAKYHPGFESQLKQGKMKITPLETVGLVAESMGSYSGSAKNQDQNFWDRWNENLAGITTKKIMPSFDAIAGFKIKGEESAIRKWERKYLPEWLSGKKVTKQSIDESFGIQFSKGAYSYVRERPLDIAAYMLAFEGLGFGIGAAGAGIAVKGIQIARPIKWGYAVGLPALYGLSVFREYQAMPTKKAKAGFLGEEAVRFGTMTFGISSGMRHFTQVSGLWRTRGTRFVPPEDVIDPKVLTGEQTFPISKASKQLHIKLFKESPYQLDIIEKYTGSRYQPGTWERISRAQYPLKKIIPSLGVWHASDSTFTKVMKTMPGKRELSGLFTAPSLSAYFLRLRSTSEMLYSFDLFPKGLPTALYLYPESVKPLSGSISQMNKFLIETAPKGSVYAPGIKAEIEAIAPPGGEWKLKGRRYYTKFEGVRVPIFEFEPVLGEGVKTNMSKVGRMFKIASSYKKPALLSPSSFLRISPSSLFASTLKSIPSGSYGSFVSGYAGTNSRASSYKGSSASSAISGLYSSVIGSSKGSYLSRILSGLSGGGSRISRSGYSFGYGGYSVGYSGFPTVLHPPPPKVPGISSSFNGMDKSLKKMFAPLSIKSYTPTLIGAEFMKPVKFKKKLLNIQFPGAFSIRPVAYGKLI